MAWLSRVIDRIRLWWSDLLVRRFGYVARRGRSRPAYVFEQGATSKGKGAVSKPKKRVRRLGHELVFWNGSGKLPRGYALNGRGDFISLRRERRRMETRA